MLAEGPESAALIVLPRTTVLQFVQNENNPPPLDRPFRAAVAVRSSDGERKGKKVD